MFFLVILAVLALIAIGATIFQISTDGYRAVETRAGSDDAYRRTE